MRVHTRAALLALLAFIRTGDAAAQPSFGPQLSYGTEADLGAGIRGFVPMPRARAIEIIASADYFFGDERPDSDVTWVEVTGGAVLPLGLDTPWEGDGYAGASVGVSFITATPADEPGGDTDVFPGLNLVTGWRAETRNFASFVEVRAVIGAAGQVVFTAGLAFGGGR